MIWLNFILGSKSICHCFIGELGMAQWWERSPPNNVAGVQIPASRPYVGWVCCWFSPLLREGLLRVLRFSPFLKSQHFQIPIRPEIRYTKNHYVEVLPANRYLFIYLFIYLGGGRKARKRGKGKGAPYQLSSIPLPFFHSPLSPTFLPTFLPTCYAG